MSTRIGTAAGALALGLVLAGCNSGPGAPDAAPSAPAVEGTTAPCPEQPARMATGGEVLADVTVDCLGGGQLHLGQAQGVPTVVNLWATWCGPCREELPLVQQLADRAGNRLKVVGLVSKDTADNGAAFAADAGVTMPTGIDADGRLVDAQRLPALPYTYLLRADGTVAHLQMRPVTSVEELEGLVAEHLEVTL